MKEPLVSVILKYALYATFAVGIIVSASLPFMLETYVYITQGHTSIGTAYRAFIVPFLMGVSIPCLWIIMEMILMLHSIPKGPFVMRNVHALYRTGFAFLVLVIAFLVKCFMYFTFLTMVCAIIFVGGGLFSFTLAALIRQSIVLREENDLTI